MAIFFFLNQRVGHILFGTCSMMNASNQNYVYFSSPHQAALFDFLNNCYTGLDCRFN